MIEQSVTKLSQTEWAALIIFSPKKEGTLLDCVGYKRLNALKKRDLYHIHRMDECVDALRDATVFFTLDGTMG